MNISLTGTKLLSLTGLFRSVQLSFFLVSHKLSLKQSSVGLNILRGSL